MRAALILILIAIPAATGAAPCQDTAACEKACSARAPEACTRAAEAYFDGKNGSPVDVARSFALARRACDAGDAYGCALVGFHYQDGLGTEWSPARAVATYEQACKAGAGVACFNLAGMYGDGHGVEVDDGKYKTYLAHARDKWTAACNGSGTRWCTNLGFLVERDGDRATAATLHKRACAGGDPIGCAEAARIAFAAGSVKPEAYIRELVAQCEAGAPHACGNAGSLLVLGDDGVVKDAARGVALLRRGCERGDGNSCHLAAIVLAAGQDVPRDAAAALKYDELACDRHQSRACLDAGKVRVATDRAAAVALARRACQMGRPDGCELVAAAAHDGKRDAEAMRWTREACRMGARSSCDLLIARDLPMPVPAAERSRMYAAACGRGVKVACKHVAK